jgi:integrative and conjugative element protein (TIGR02256 family)
MSTVLFTTQAARQLAALAPLADDGLETGGILLGADYGLAGPLIVRQCGGPGPAAIRRRMYFRRDLAHAAALAEQAAALDGSAWIGEWHTHSAAMSEPSSRDLHTYRKLLLDPQLAFPRILAVIALAGLDASWHAPVLHAWSFTGSVLRKLPIASAEDHDRSASQPGDKQ